MLSSLVLVPFSSIGHAAKKVPQVFTAKVLSTVRSVIKAPKPALLATAACSPSYIRATGAINVHPMFSFLNHQVRNFGAPRRYKGKGRKRKGQKRAPRQERALPPPPPILNAVPREVRRAEVDRKDQEFAEHLKLRVAQQPSVLRFDMTSVPMSDRVKKLFELTNGSQREVVKAQKERGIQLFQKREGDTGSSAVQIVALTTRIQQLQAHMATHRKDYSSKRGMDALYVRRRKLLDYLERTDFESYRNVAKTLGLAR